MQDKRYHMTRSYAVKRELRQSWIKLLAEELFAISEETSYETWLMDFPAKVAAGIISRNAAVVSGAGMAVALRGRVSRLLAACIATMVKSMCFEIGWFSTLRISEGVLKMRERRTEQDCSKTDICELGADEV